MGFGSHCSGLASQLLDLKYKRTDEEKRSGEKDDQLRLFHLTNEQREDFLKFAGNLRWFIADHKVTTTEGGVTSESFWEGYRKFEYTDYDIVRLFEFVKKEEVEAVAAMLERVGNGETLTDEETKTAMNWLHAVGHRAHAHADDGGCF